MMPYARGAAVYHDNCAACHGGDGKGEKALFPPLAGNADRDPVQRRKLDAGGAGRNQAAQTERRPHRAGDAVFRLAAEDGQIADMLTYVRSNWGNAAAPVSAESVGESRSRLRGS